MAARQIVPDPTLLRQGTAPNYGLLQQQANTEEDERVAKEDRIAKYNKWMQDSISAAPQWGGAYANSIGLNAADPKIASIIQQISGDLAQRAPRDMETGNPEQYFNSDAFQQGFNDYESRARRGNVSQVRNTFQPGIESKLLPDSDIDNIVNTILGEQKGLASTKLGYQTKRGLLNPVGAEYANKTLGNQEKAGRSTLSSLGSGVLGKDRADLTDIISQAGNAASSWMLGNDAFSVSPYQQQINEKAARNKGNLEGDVRSALGNTQLFDIPTLVSQAGTAQGSDNLNFGSAPGEGKKKTISRGLGSTGGGF